MAPLYRYVPGGPNGAPACRYVPGGVNGAPVPLRTWWSEWRPCTVTYLVV